MKLEKVIIDGNVYYREVKDEEVKEQPEENAQGKDESVGTDKKEKTDAQMFFEKMGKGAKDVSVKIVHGAKAVGSKITVGAKDIGVKIKEGTERLFSKDKSTDPNSTEAKLLRLLPYMNKEDAHELCEKILASPCMFQKINVAEIMPFVTQEDCDALFLNSIKNSSECDIAKAVPFVSHECLSHVVDGYVAGEYPELDVDSLYPFLEDAEIKKIFYHIING